MSQFRARLLILVAAIAVGGAVWFAADVQRRSATHAATRMQATQQLLTSMLDQETGLRGFQLTGQESFLAPLRVGRRGEARAAASIRSEGAGNQELLKRLAAAIALADRWRLSADGVVVDVRAKGPHAPSLEAALGRKRLMDGFRNQVSGMQNELNRERVHDQRVAAALSVGISLVVFAVLGLAGLVWWRRHTRGEVEREAAERRYRESQLEFSQTMSIVSSEAEANALLKRHLERWRPGRDVAVLNRNNSANRLEPMTVLSEDDPLAERLRDAGPRDCLAVRLGRAHEERAGENPLLTCELCGDTRERLCAPLLVSGEVIGSVLSRQPEPFDDQARDRMTDSVTIAAPVLGNLRTIAIAESRAATDALTGLPNRRAIDDNLRRMFAQAARTGTPLTAVAIDLDHFKQINDLYGHDRGDDVLAAVAAALQGAVRASDFVGRQGGEELLVLAPDTPLAGALKLADHLRATVERIDVAGVDRAITASFGVAVMPDSAATSEELMRQADRALYAAKERGRNRVESIGAVAPVATPA